MESRHQDRLAQIELFLNVREGKLTYLLTEIADLKKEIQQMKQAVRAYEPWTPEETGELKADFANYLAGRAAASKRTAGAIRSKIDQLLRYHEM